MSVWERLLAMFLGITVLPASVLYYSAVFLFVLLKALIELSPFIFTIVLDGWRRFISLPSYEEMFEQAIIHILTVTITACIVTGYFSGSFFLMVLNAFFRFAYQGVVQGYNGGMEGYNRLSEELRQEFELITSDNEPNPLQVTPLEMPTSKLLDADELKDALRITKDYLISKKSVVLKAELQSLITKVERYQTLLSTLDKVKDALKKSDFSEIEDQLIPYTDIHTPIVLEKLYLGVGNFWHAVPMQTYISNNDTFLEWLKQKNIHPLSRDSINNPGDYNGKKTRYSWKILTTEDCNVVELHDVAEEIRALIKVVAAKPAFAVNPESSAPGVFFAVAPVKEQLNEPGCNSLPSSFTNR